MISALLPETGSVRTKVRRKLSFPTGTQRPLMGGVALF